MPKHYNRKPAGVGSLLRYAIGGLSSFSMIDSVQAPGATENYDSDAVAKQFPRKSPGMAALRRRSDTNTMPKRKITPTKKKSMTPKTSNTSKTPIKVNTYRGTTPATAKSPGPGGEYSPAKKKKVMQRSTTKGNSAFSVKSVLKNPWAYAVGGGLASLALYNILSGDDEKKGGPPKDPVTPGRYIPRW